jgi:cytochrome c
MQFCQTFLTPLPHDTQKGQFVAPLYLATKVRKRIDSRKTANELERDMFDTMTMTKTIGGLCGTFLVFLLGGWVAELIYHGGEGGHGDHHDQAYVIPVEGDVVEEVVAGPPFAEIYAVADAAAGEGAFRPCSACHKVDGTDGVGPHLNGVVDRAVGSVDGFGYSGSLVAVAEQWTPENLNAFLENPKGYAPGTAMNYGGMRKIEDRANLIAYLASVGG